MTEASRLQEILELQTEAKLRCEQLGGDPKYMNSYATFLLAHATSLVALELNKQNSILLSSKGKQPNYP